MRIEIDTDQRTPSWDIAVGDDEPCFLGVEQCELDELKEQLGFVVMKQEPGMKCYTLHERPVTMDAQLLRQMIMTCEKYYALPKQAKQT